MGRYEEAVEQYNLAIAKDDQFKWAFNNLGLALGRLGRYEEAIERYKQAIAVMLDCFAIAFHVRHNRRYHHC